MSQGIGSGARADAVSWIPAGRPWGSLDSLSGAWGDVIAQILAAGLRWEVGLTRQLGDGSEPDAAPPDSFEDAFAAHEADVVRVCRRILGGREEARDAPQEVFLRAQRSYASYDSSRPFRPWLLALAGNYCIDRLRRRATEERIFADVDPDEAIAPDATQASPLAQVLARERQEAVGRAIAGLGVKYRLPLVLRYFGEMDYEAIGEALGISKGQVGSLLFRAKQQLREAVAESAGPGERRSRRAEGGRR